MKAHNSFGGDDEVIHDAVKKFVYHTSLGWLAIAIEALHGEGMEQFLKKRTTIELYKLMKWVRDHDEE